MARRARSVRTRIVTLLVPPIIALVALWAFAAATTLGDALRQARSRTFTEKVVRPTDAMIDTLQDERRMSLSYLGDDSTIGRSGFDAQRAKTDRTRAAFRRSAADPSIRGAATPETRRRMVDLAASLSDLESVRDSVDRRQINRAQALARYTGFIDQAAEIYDETRSSDERILRDTRVLDLLERARESLSREDALITGALTAGRLSEDEHRWLVELAGTRRFLYGDSTGALADGDRRRYEAIIAGPEFSLFQQLESRLIQVGPTEGRPPVDVGAWHTSTEAVDIQLAELSSRIRTATAARAADKADSVLLRLALAGGVGLLAVVAAIVIAVRMGHRLIRESRGIADAVAAFTRDRIPAISERARRGEPVPGEDPGPATEFAVTEIGRIDAAFTEARMAVVRASESEAAAHKRINDVFLTLARRNQSLLQRLLGLLEGMERDTEDPDALAALFELDHLATRMRRHAEGLVILSGRPSGRSWRHPVRLMDVARAAASEVADYTRVEVVPMGRTALSGRAVADTIHLLAELIENAAVFSPPTTRIRVTGGEAAHGFAIEVEDRGLGLSAEELERLNGLLATDPELDFDDSVRLGLFVVARLAARHGIRVVLRSSPYGGVVAIVLIPHELVVELPAMGEGSAEDGSGEHRSLVAVSGMAETAGEGHRTRSAPGPVPAVEGAPAPDPLALEGGREESGAETGQEAEGEHGLPRRQRQRSLAPQLREAPPEPGGAAPVDRPPEAAGHLLAEMQSGWRRGRAEAGGDAGPAVPGTQPPPGSGGE
ncbi:ATP-binding protein [Actinomadura sp. K4S16]|uniref:sensor histidine kinase n=1 Tax=Actinomadura sp. K4S16 TaxID=1316147 RepID=UPI00135A3592|nr:ATP-binding protein [Actinomadura sp. K4S16]